MSDELGPMVVFEWNAAQLLFASLKVCHQVSAHLPTGCLMSSAMVKEFSPTGGFVRTQTGETTGTAVPALAIQPTRCGPALGVMHITGHGSGMSNGVSTADGWH